VKAHLSAGTWGWDTQKISSCGSSVGLPALLPQLGGGVDAFTPRSGLLA